ncbi:hypothetical protein CHS0354_035164 [Potamilus streckersoni]|uniref:Heat shock 70 kDa protein 12A n=1 Tax=Potamilus streckersoni TaxID=2493646 RepID=A0AAE0WDD7_9BIVA|nr:hypothetical protein CHS0354_035164 [Potamilus streckersoni]
MGGKESKHRSKSKHNNSSNKEQIYERLSAVIQTERDYEEIGPRTRQNFRKEAEGSTARKLRKDMKLLTAAIDFGTTYSGYAYSFACDPGKLFAHYWEGKHIKTPTAILLNPDRTFAAFGTEAEVKYQALITSKEAEAWYYFERFKMELYHQNPPLNRDMVLKDMTGKSMRAVDIFAAGIKYLKDHLLDNINGVSEYVILIAPDIHWILTVPAIWNDSAKQFMREAAREAGIDDDSLTIALEPEVASMYCKAKAREQVNSAAKQDSERTEPFQPGTKYLVLDLGGGTADITCHEVQEDGNLAELHQATGGDYGGKNVDEEFRQFLTRTFGTNVLSQFKDQYLEEYLELFNTFNRKKRLFSCSTETVTFSCPDLLEIYKRNTSAAAMKVDDANCELLSNVEFERGKIRIGNSLFKSFFDQTLSNIIHHVSDLLRKVPDLSYIVMVGGFSESEYVYNRMQEMFGTKVLRPDEPSGAVLKGAVLFGDCHTIITRRISKYSYGIARMIKFKPGFHPPEKKKIIDGFAYVDDVFNKHIEVGQSIAVGQDVDGQEYFPAKDGLTQAVLEVYASKDRSTRFVTDEGCFFVGLLSIDLSKYSDHKKWPLLVKLLFGGTELVVEILEVKTNKLLTAAVDFLG